MSVPSRFAPSTAALGFARYEAMNLRHMPAAAQNHAKAKATSEEFESVFLSNMINQMFESVSGDGPLGGKGAAGTWRSFLADEYAKSFAKSGGVGIADQVYRQLLQIQEKARS